MSECLRVMKPGAHGLVWAIPRTSHWTATALEDAGFEVRDVVTHLFGSGFPKSYNVAKGIDKMLGVEPTIVGKIANLSSTKNRVTMGRPEHSGSGFQEDPDLTVPSSESAAAWKGWGTALKPASEHWILVRKPCSEKTVAANVLKWGTGALNIDASRVSSPDIEGTTRDHKGKVYDGVAEGYQRPNKSSYTHKTNWEAQPQGRFPANLVLDEEAAQALDEQSGVLPPRGNVNPSSHADKGMFGNGIERRNDGFSRDRGGASRFFYVAKASKSDKGCDNTHPTVKSTALMSYLIKLITPPNGVVLDPFMGSGSTGVAAVKGGFGFLGIEKESEYVEIAEKRLAAA